MLSKTPVDFSDVSKMYVTTTLHMRRRKLTQNIGCYIEYGTYVGKEPNIKKCSGKLRRDAEAEAIAKAAAET